MRNLRGRQPLCELGFLLLINKFLLQKIIAFIVVRSNNNFVRCKRYVKNAAFKKNNYSTLLKSLIYPDSESFI